MLPAPAALLDDVSTPSVRGTIHAVDGPPRDGIVLTHGAGGDQHAALLVALAIAFASAGVTALRCDLPFRQARAAGPPGAGSAPRDRAGLARALDVLRTRVPGRLFVGGHSYGGRQASMLAADQPGLVAGVLLTSYPLHPPGRPAAPRTAHFGALCAPVLFVHGSRDTFGTLDEVGLARRDIPAPSSLVPVDGAGHDLVRRTGAMDLAQVVVRAFMALVG